MFQLKKQEKNTHHEYISTKQYHHGFVFRLSNYFVLLSTLLIHKYFAIPIPESVYLLIFSGIVGYDIPTILNLVSRVMGKRK